MKRFSDINLQSTLKQKTYTLLYELWRLRKDNNIIYRFIILVEACQLCWFSISPKFIHNPSAMQWLEKALHAIQIDNALDKNNEKGLLSLLDLAFGWQMLYVLIFGFCIVYRISKPNSEGSRGQPMMIKFLNFSSMLISYLLALPIFQIYFTVMICVKEREAYGDLVCYQGIYFLHVVLAFLGMIMHIIISVTFLLFHSDLNPFSNSAGASPQNRHKLYRLFIKFLLPLMALLTYKNKSMNIVVYFYAVLWLIVLVYRWRQTPDVNRMNYFFTVGVDTLTLWLIIYELVRLVSVI